LTDLFSYDDVHELLKSSILDMDNVVQEIHTSKEGGDVSWKEAASPYYEKMCQCGHNAMLAGQQYASWFDPDLSKSAFDFDWDYRSDIDQMAGGLGIPVSKKNVDTLHRALANGEPIPTRELEKDFDYEKAQDVGRTVMLNIYAKAALRRWDGDGIVHCRRIEMRDRKTCPICRSLHGKQYVIREVLNQLYPQSHDTHPRCLLPGTMVSPGGHGNILGGFVSTYDGPIVELVLADGRRLSATINHMLLTPEGFLRARHLRKGDHVLGRPLGQWNRTGVPDDDDKPAPIEEVVGSFAESGSMATMSVPVSAENFHGDGVFMSGNVDIVGAYSELGGALNPEDFEFLSKPSFGGCLDSLSLSPLGMSDKLFQALRLATDGGMSRLRESKSLLLGELRPADGAGVRNRSPSDAMLLQDAIHRDFVDAKTFSNLKGRLVGVAPNHGIMVDEPTLASSSLAQPPIDRISADAERIGQVLSFFPGEVAPLEIVEINQNSFHGPVYDLCVGSSLYWAEGIVTSNCRGTFLPVLDTATTYKPQRQEFPAGINFTVAGNVAENVPMEIKPWLYTFMRRSPVPLHVKFDDALDAAYEWDGFEVTISPEALKHEDPREIILRSVADQIWPEVQPEFSEYKNLVKGGHAIPAKSWENDKELFVNNYIAYRMGQDEYPRSVAWLKRVAG